MIKNIKPRCPVDIGDYFYHNNYCVSNDTAMPDYIEVLSITELEKPMLISEERQKYAYYKIHGRYIYHMIGPDVEKDFCEAIFEDPEWIIEKKGRSKRI